MSIEYIKDVFMWCTIINAGVLIVWVLLFKAMPNRIYDAQKMIFSISRENFDMLIYGLLGVYKLIFIIFVLIPFISLSIVGF